MKLLFFVGILLVFFKTQAATIYLCEGYSGGGFFSNGPCSQQKAIAREFFNVSDTFSFQQQVEIVKQKIAQRNAVSNPQPVQSQSNNKAKCAELHKERLEIESYDVKMQWRPIEELNKAQHRMRGLRAEMTQRGCPMQ